VKGAQLPVGVGFVGLGRIASLLEDDPFREKPASHAGAFGAHPECRIVGGYDSNPDRVRGFAERWDTRGFGRVEELLDEARPDILVIATHPDSHEEYLRRAIAAKTSVVVCEKPLAHSLRSARRMAAMARRSPTRVVINHERRFSRDYRMARDAVMSGELGRLLSVSGRLYFGSSTPLRAMLLHDGTHLIDAIHYLTGERIRVGRRIGDFRRPRSSAYLIGVLEGSETPVSIEIGAERDHLLFEITLSFVSGQIIVGNGIFSWEMSVPSPHYDRYRSLQTTRRNVPEPTGYFRGMAEEAVRLLRNPGTQSDSSVEDGLAVMRVVGRHGRLHVGP
jgi:predicted dehydrogenase